MIMTRANRFAFITAGLGLVAVSSIFSPGAAAAQAPGQQLFMANNCYLCHGTVGQGGTGPRIAPPDLPEIAGFMAYVRHPAGGMPAYTTKVLSDADLTAIHGYLESLPQPNGLPGLLSRSTGNDAK
jgi:mono/diheme cytochrome c family protein